VIVVEKMNYSRGSFRIVYCMEATYSRSRGSQISGRV